jgi:hypothetical protein
MVWARTFGIGSAIMSGLFALVLFTYLPKESGCLGWTAIGGLIARLHSQAYPQHLIELRL